MLEALGTILSRQLDVRRIATELERVEAKSDIDRVTVFAQAAKDAGMEGINYETADRLYEELGIPKPSRWAKPFSNAKQRGLVRNLAYGLWGPTVAGENFARHGIRPQARRRATTRRDAGDDAPRLPELEGGES